MKEIANYSMDTARRELVQVWGVVRSGNQETDIVWTLTRQPHS